MSDLHVIHQSLSDRIVLSKTRTTKDGLTILTSERPQDVTEEALRAVAAHFYLTITTGGPDSIVFGLENGRELWLTAHIKDPKVRDEDLIDTIEKLYDGALNKEEKE